MPRLAILTTLGEIYRRRPRGGERRFWSDGSVAIARSANVWPGPGAFEDVLAAAQRGDEGAFLSLWRWAQPLLLRWLAVVAPGHGGDIASEVWMAVARGLTSFGGGEREFTTWIFLMARRRALTATRDAARAPLNLGPQDVTRALSTASGAAAVNSAVSLIRTLPPDEAEVVALRVIAGFSLWETALVVGKSEAEVSTLFLHGLGALMRRLEHNSQLRA
jgi:RNA polymerase sigma-70 factor (ECF subfamily)